MSVRDHMMVAHSLRGAVFGPARALHGATYVVDVELRREDLDGDGLVADIGLASKALREVLATFNYRNLDDEPAFAKRNTTTEFLARAVFDRMAEKVAAGALGAGGGDLASMKVTLAESPVARASFEGRLTGAAG